MKELDETKIYGQYHYGVTFQNQAWTVIKEFRSINKNYIDIEYVQEFGKRAEAVAYAKQLKKEYQEARKDKLK